ncbi:MAG: hypothetical protein JNJ45_09250 [Chthonomonas sp.]|nr:hypothetical protein [Chthonomonas sp.]
MRNLETALKTNSLNEGSGLWQMKQELNTFFTGTEPASSFSGDRVMRGNVVWRTGEGLDDPLPSQSDPGDKSSHYFYVWHPDMGGPLGTGLNPPTRYSYRTLLDKGGRFAVKLPTSWAYVFVRTEQSLWRKVGFSGRGPGGTNSPPPGESRTYLPWLNINAWQPLELAYGDMDENNEIKNSSTSGHPDGWMNASATDLDQWKARDTASVKLVTPFGKLAINYYHLGVDLNRDLSVDSYDFQALDKYPANPAQPIYGARQ